MRGLFIFLILVSLSSCADSDLSWIAIENETQVPIYALPYSSEFTDGQWIQPGLTDEFYSIACDCLDGFAYFSFYYDSLIIFIKDHDDAPVKFFKDGSAVNYDATLNPFTNPEVWKTRSFHRHMEGNGQETLVEKQIWEHYFSIETEKIKSLSDTLMRTLSPI